MALQPLGDVAMIELEVDEFGFGGDEDRGVDNGILAALPDKFNYFGFFSFSFEDSFMAHDELKELHTYYTGLIGKRVFWPSLSEKGMVFRDGEKRYAMIKLTSLIGHCEPDDEVRNVYNEKSGAYAA